MNGYIHSIESFGTVDGPGIRYVVFLQGCPMRCQYCHNPDTWATQQGKQLSAEEILQDYESYRPFLKKGGLTVTGGEPLLQMDFVIDLFEKAKARSIHTCLDTSGILFPETNTQLQKWDRLCASLDLVLLDIKHIDDENHRKLTGFSNRAVLAFAKYLDKKKIPVWIRHVVVPTITDQQESLERLGQFLGTLSNVRALDILPYHDMGKAKYEALGIAYPLADLSPLPKETAIWAKETVLQAMQKQRICLQKTKDFHL